MNRCVSIQEVTVLITDITETGENARVNVDCRLTVKDGETPKAVMIRTLERALEMLNKS